MQNPVGHPRAVPTDQPTAFDQGQLLTLQRRMAEHVIGGAGRALSFEARLAQEQGLDLPTARAWIREYQRFCQLIVITGQELTPSDAVDQVWHLHMIYQEDYRIWCDHVLGRDLVHGPTAGGISERDKFRDWYCTTLLVYQAIIGKPPSAIWPRPALRFAGSRRRMQVPVHRYLVVPRWWPVAICFLMLVPGFALVGFEQPGLAVILLLTTIVVACLICAGVPRTYRRQPERSSRRPDSHSGCGAGSGCGNATSCGTSDSGSGCSGGSGCGGGGCGGS